jgi:hypothetical protein
MERNALPAASRREVRTARVIYRNRAGLPIVPLDELPGL